MSYITGGGIFYGGGFITIGVGTTQTPVYSSFVISSILVGTTLTLSVASTSPAPITFSLTTTPSTGVATITNGNTLNILGLGTVTVTASQPAYNNLYFSGSTSTTFSVTSVPSTLTANLSLVFTPTTSDATSYSIAGNATIATVNGNQVFSISGNGTITVYLGTVTRDFSTGIQPLIMGSRGSSNPITGSYSLSFLLFYTTINTTQTIVFNDNNNPYFLFGFDGTNRNFAMYINHTTKTTASLSSDLSMNTWNSFVITYDSLTAGGTVQLYVNTVPLTMANNTGITSAVDVNPLVLGSTGSIPSFTGYVNDVLIYNNVITTSVIQQIYSFEQTTQTLANVITTTTPGGTIAPTSTIVTTYPSTVQLYNLYQLFGYTLVICSQTLVNNANQRIFEFNNASSAPTEYIYASPYTSGSSQSGLYAYSTLSSATYATDLSNSTIYTLYFSYSTNRIIMNGYQADASGNLTSKTSQSLSYDTSGTVYNPSFMTDCSNLWFGKSGTTTNYYYNGSYSQICLYNGNLNTDASYSYLKELITTPSINTYTSTTYTFGATSHFIPVTVSVSGSVTSTATNIKVNGTSTTSGGYLTLSSFSTTATTNSYGIGQPIIWGSGTSSFGTPTNITIATPYTPALLSKYTSYFNGKTIKYVSPSYNGYFYIDSLNRVHSGGTPNANGQLGNGQVQFSTNYALSDITNNGSFRGATIVQIISTGNYVMALDSSGNIHGFGDDVNTGCLAQGVARTTAYVPFNITTSSSLNSIYNRKIVSTAGSGSTMVVADSSGYVHTCGVGSGGTNGNNPTTNTSTSNRTQNISVVGASTGTNITGSSLIGRFITSVYAAAQQSTLFALDSSGYLHIWGGFGTFGTIVNTFANGTTSNNIYLPINISTLKTLPNNVFYGKTIIGMTNNVAYGGAGILFWDSNGYMYSWQTSIYDNTYPLIVNNIIGSSLFGKKVIGGATSGYISYALDSNGQLHSWANNQNSNPGITTGLGDGTYGSYNYPVNLSSNINSILYGKNIVNININGGGGGSVWSILALYSSGATYISPTAPVNNTVANKVYAFGTTNNGLFGNGTTANPSTANTMYQGVTGFGDLSLNHSSIVGIYTTPNSQVVYFLDTSGLAYMCNTTANNNQSFYQAYSNITPLCISNFGSLENVTIQSISVGYGSIFALDTSGKVHGWGSTDMGYGTLLTSSSTPVRISDLSSSALYGKTIIQVLGSTFNANNYAIDTSQNIYYWSTSITTPILYTGWNSYLQNPMKTVFTYYSTSYPILLDVTGIVADYNISTIMPSLIGTTIFSLATTQNGTYGSSHTGAIDSSGNVWMWGINANGQLGNGTTTTSTVAINISALSTGSLYRKKAISLYCGYNASVAVDTSGNIHYWGTTSTLTTSNNLWPVLISSTYASQLNQPDLTVALGSGNGYIALNYTGTIPTKLIWNGVYLAVGTTTTLPAPLSNSPGAFVYYSSNPLVASISGNQITVYSKGTVTISVYQLASGTYSAASKSITNTMQNGVYTQIFGTNFYITLTGNNLFGSTTSTLPILWQGWNGYGDISSNGNNMVKVVAVANEGSIGLDNTGKLYVCSINSNASSFNCGVNNAYVPTSIMNSGSLVGRTIIDFVATGYGHNGSCYAIDSSGNLHGWGSSIYTMGVGDGTTTAYTTPQNLSNVSSTVLYQKKMVQISTSYNSGQIALDSSNQVYIWGIYNYTFYNGVTGYTATTTPLNVTTFGSLNGVTVVQVASGYGLYALDSSGQVHMLGSNGPYTINTFNNISNIAGSSLNNVIVAKFIISNSLPLNLTGFLDSAGNVHTWGSTVGDGTTTAYVNTVNISQITTSPIYGKQIMFGHVNNVATHLIDTSGVVYYWGSTGYSSPNNLLPYSIDLSYSQFQNNKIIYASMMYGGAGSNFAHYVAQYSNQTYSVSPTSISTIQLWLDAQDFSTLTVSGYLVTQWNDKSGLGRNATPYQSSNPTILSSTFKSCQALTFAANQGLVCPMPANTIATAMTCFVMFQDTGSSSTPQSVVSRTQNGIPTPFAMNNASRFTGDGNIGDTVTNTSSLNLGQATGYNLLCFTIQSGGNWIEYLNGQLDMSTNYTINSFTDSASNFYIGSNDNGTTSFTGVLGEIIVYNRVLTTTERQSIEGYLAYKWNVPWQLPSSHPYYNILNQTVITFPAISTKTYGTDTSFSIVATSTSPATIYYSSSNTAVATIVGSQVTIVGAGTCTITAMQFSSSLYHVSTTGTPVYNGGSATTTLTVLSNQSVSLFGGLLAPMVGALTIPTSLTVQQQYTIINPTSTSPGAFTYTSSNPSVASISGNVLTINSLSNYIINVTQSASGNYSNYTINVPINIYVTKSITISQNNYLIITNNFLPTTTSIFTIEGWIYPLSFPTLNTFGTYQIPCLIGDMGNSFNGQGGSNYWSIGPSSTGIMTLYENASSGFYLKSDNTISLNQWTHFAITSDGSNYRMYINGTIQSSLLGYANRGGTIGSITIGNYNGTYYNGYVDNIRVSNSLRYSSSFTVSTTTFVSDSNTLFLMQYNGTNFIDNSPNNYTITKQGSPSVSSISPFI